MPALKVRSAPPSRKRSRHHDRRSQTETLPEVETLAIARGLAWKVHMRCNGGYRQETQSMRKCVYRKQLDLETLVATRGPKLSPSHASVFAPLVSSLWKSTGDGRV